MRAKAAEWGLHPRPTCDAFYFTFPAESWVETVLAELGPSKRLPGQLWVAPGPAGNTRSLVSDQPFVSAGHFPAGHSIWLLGCLQEGMRVAKQEEQAMEATQEELHPLG